MILTQDMKEFLELLEKYKVEYVLVGGFAVNYYGYIRTTHFQVPSKFLPPQ